MRSHALACALFGSLLLACNRTSVASAPGATHDAGDMPDATSARMTTVANDAAMQDASGTTAAEAWDGCGIGDGSPVLQDGAYGAPGWTCIIPPQARSSATCRVSPYPNDTPPHCPRSSQYELFCAEAIDESALGCSLIAMEEAPDRGYDYCCSCEGTDAATGCVNVDPSTYDRSCSRDSDCMFIWSGMTCPGSCAYACGLGNAAINVDGRACYEQTLAPLSAASLDTVCHCPNQGYGAPGPVCLQGVCTVPK